MPASSIKKLWKHCILTVSFWFWSKRSEFLSFNRDFLCFLPASYTSEEPRDCPDTGEPVPGTLAARLLRRCETGGKRRLGMENDLSVGPPIDHQTPCFKRYFFPFFEMNTFALLAFWCHWYIILHNMMFKTEENQCRHVDENSAKNGLHHSSFVKTPEGVRPWVAPLSPRNTTLDVLLDSIFTDNPYDFQPYHQAIRGAQQLFFVFQKPWILKSTLKDCTRPPKNSFFLEGTWRFLGFLEV